MTNSSIRYKNLKIKNKYTPKRTQKTEAKDELKTNIQFNNNSWRLQYSTFNNQQEQINKETEDLKNTINQQDFKAIYRTLPPTHNRTYILLKYKPNAPHD